MKEAEIRSGGWIEPVAGQILFGGVRGCLDQRSRVQAAHGRAVPWPAQESPAADFGNVEIAAIRDADVRRWRKERLDAGPRQARPFGPVVVAKAYRLLHGIMSTAVEDGRIRRNPCRIKGAGQEHSAERPVIPVVVLVELLDNVPARYRSLLLLATFANLRFGELAGLRRNQVDLDLCEVRVDRSTAELDDGRLIEAGPKSHAGIRTVGVPQGHRAGAA